MYIDFRETEQSNRFILKDYKGFGGLGVDTYVWSQFEAYST